MSRLNTDSLLTTESSGTTGILRHDTSPNILDHSVPTYYEGNCRFLESLKTQLCSSTDLARNYDLTYALSENLAAEDGIFRELRGFCDCTGTFYSLRHMHRGCEAIWIPAVTLQPIGTCKNVQKCLVYRQRGGGWGNYVNSQFLGIAASQNLENPVINYIVTRRPFVK